MTCILYGYIVHHHYGIQNDVTSRWIIVHHLYINDVSDSAVIVHLLYSKWAVVTQLLGSNSSSCFI